MASPPSKHQSFCLLTKSTAFSDFIGNLQITPQHMAQYQKNYKLVRERFRRRLAPLLSPEEVRSSYFCNDNRRKAQHHHITPKEIYLYLSLLSVFEVQIQKRQACFKPSDWHDFASNLLFTSAERAQALNQRVFKRNQTNFPWSPAEDLLLSSLMSESSHPRRVKWTRISSLFNQSPEISQQRSAPQCKQRWENTLKKSFKIGEWESEEDLTILRYVLEHGPRWALLAKQFVVNRNQHAVKNRFFSLVSTYTLIPIRKIKREIEYLNKFLIKETLEYHVKVHEGKGREKIEENYRENGLRELEDGLPELCSDEFLNYILSPSEEGLPLCSYFDDLMARM